MHKVRHWNYSKAPVWFLKPRRIKNVWKKLNESEKKYLNTRLTPTILTNGTFILLYSNVPKHSAKSDTPHQSKSHNLVFGTVKNWKYLEKLKGSENNTKVFQRPCNVEEPVLLSTNSKIVKDSSYSEKHWHYSKITK